mmetsp:Transcript_24790/g.28560  ORF Transcript_24790/g.28560 Transcript_24790/m.28560 type:complete len:446 (+) Transcript_24790:208-1545(+)
MVSFSLASATFVTLVLTYATTSSSAFSGDYRKNNKISMSLTSSSYHGFQRSATASSFCSSSFAGKQFRLCPAAFSQQKKKTEKGRNSGSELNMFMGSDGGILGIGTPELITIVLVGYFILGPSELFKLTKQIGKAITNIQTLGAEATRNFEDQMEDTINIEEIRKTQQELSEVFNFRRTINQPNEYDFTTEPPPVAPEPTMAAAATTAAAAVATTEEAVDNSIAAPKKKKRIVRRRKKKIVEPEPDLDLNVDMPSDWSTDSPSGMADDDTNWFDAPPATPFDGTGNIEDLEMPQQPADDATEFNAYSREARMERLKSSGDGIHNDATENADPSYPDDTGMGSMFNNIEDQSEEQSRFAAQLSGGWNKSVMDSEDELSPLPKIMERLAILEEEKNAADARLEEEFRLRGELEEKYYREKRSILEEAASDTQMNAYVGMENDSSSSD